MTRRGFTLVELIASMVILSLLAGVSASLLMRAGDAFSGTRERRGAVQGASMALDRVLSELRGAGGLSAVRVDGFDLGSGLSIDRAGTRLEIDDGAGPEPLCEGVSAFEVVYLDADGAVISAADADAAERVRRVAVRLVVATASGPIELRGLAAVRSHFAWRAVP